MKRAAPLCASLLAVIAARRVSAAEELEFPEDYRPIATWEYGAAPALLAGALALRFFGPQTKEQIRATNGFDRAVAEALVVRTRDGRHWIELASDIPFYGLIAFPIAEAAALGIAHSQGELTRELIMMGMESAALVGVVVYVSQALVNRERPTATLCAQDPGYDCEAVSDDGRAFISGHVAAMVTGAALVCVHHDQLDLYGGPWPCAIASSLAALSSAGRLFNGSHYPSDVVLGIALGLVAGWVLPMSLHYGWGGEPSRGAPRVRSIETPLIRLSF